MRRLAVLREPRDEVRSLVLHEADGGVYVFPRKSAEDGPCCTDYWFDDLMSAEAFCGQKYGVNSSDWRAVADPLPGCQHDWVAPVRVKGRKEGTPLWGTFERLEDDGVWREIESTGPRGAG
jgi:biofilm protein TabA